MGVIALPSFAPQGVPATDDWELRSLSARFQSPLNGVSRTLERPGSHWAVTLRYHNLSADKRGRMQSFLSACRGHAQRFYVPYFGWSNRGSFPASEILTNNDFASGTTGWNSFSEISRSVADWIYRGTRSGVSATMALITPSANPTVTQYAPHAWRVLVSGKSYPVSLRADVQDNAGSAILASGSSESGSSFVSTVGFVPYETAVRPRLIDLTFSGLIAGHFAEIAYTSLARCALVDNGPNIAQRSSELDNAYWNKSQTTVNANAATAPDGNTTADTIVENGASSQHSVNRTETRASSVADWCVYGYFKRAVGTRNLGLVVGRDGTNHCRVIFDLGAGTVSTTSVAGDATNARGFIASAGNNWYFCAAVCRLTASTGLLLQYEVINGTTVSYLGDSTSGLHAWRVGCAQTSVPTRGMQTTSAGDADGVAQTGNGLHLKGLPVSTNGLLLAGDPAEILVPGGSQLVRTTAALNSNAAGLGYWQFEPPLRASPVDDAAIILRNPLCRMMLDASSVRWTEHDDGFCDVEFTAVEDTYL